LGGKIDKIYWVVLSTVGAVGLMFIDTLLGRGCYETIRKLYTIRDD